MNKMKISWQIIFAQLGFMLVLGCIQNGNTQPSTLKFGKKINSGNITSDNKKKDELLQWINVNTAPAAQTTAANTRPALDARVNQLASGPAASGTTGTR